MTDNTDKKKQDVLYRYQSLNAFSEDFFSKRILHFAAPKDFNDPYDCKIVFPAIKDPGDFYSLFKEKISILKLTDQAILIGTLKTIFSDSLKKEKFLKPHVAPMTELLNSLGVLCLSEKNNDILMWSHYSDKHCGYCLILNTVVLSRFGYCNKITYRETYPLVTDFNSSTTTVRDLFIFSKSIHWDYEKEWRVVLDPRNNPKLPGSRYYEYSEELLTGIIFGCQMPQEDREKIRGWLKNRKAPLKYYEAIKKDDEYGLDIKPIK